MALASSVKQAKFYGGIYGGDEKQTMLECMHDLSSFSITADRDKVDGELLKSLNTFVGIYNAIPNYNNKFCYLMEKSGPQTSSLYLFWSEVEKAQGWWVCTAIDGDGFYALSPLGLAG